MILFCDFSRSYFRQESPNGKRINQLITENFYVRNYFSGTYLVLRFSPVYNKTSCNDFGSAWLTFVVDVLGSVWDRWRAAYHRGCACISHPAAKGLILGFAKNFFSQNYNFAE